MAAGRQGMLEAQGGSYYVGVSSNRTDGYSATVDAIQSLPPGEFPDVSGRIVVIKINLVGKYLSSTGATTDPQVVKGIVDIALQNGAAQVLIVEGGQVPTGTTTENAPPFDYCGYTDVFASYPTVQLVDIDGGAQSTVAVPGNSTMDQIQLASLLVEGNTAGPPVLISAAKMKTHSWAVATLTMKNWYGCYPPSAYEIENFICRGVPHVLGLPQTALDLISVLQPAFGVVDGIVGMQGNGPILGKPIQSGTVLAGKNLLAVDMVGVKIIGVTQHAPLIDLARKAGLGPLAISQITTVGDAWVPLNFKPANLTWPYLLPATVTGQVSHTSGSTVVGQVEIGTACNLTVDIAVYTPGAPGTVRSVKTLLPWGPVDKGTVTQSWDGTDNHGFKVPAPKTNQRYYFRATAVLSTTPISPPPPSSKSAYGTAKITFVA